MVTYSPKAGDHPRCRPCVHWRRWNEPSLKEPLDYCVAPEVVEASTKEGLFLGLALKKVCGFDRTLFQPC